MISSNRYREQPVHQPMQQFVRNGIPTMNHNPVAGNNVAGNAELTGDSLWDSLYNTTIRTLSLDGLELLAKSFDNLDPNHQLYAGIAKRQRKLMEYQSEFRRNLEVFCQRANLSPKVWPSCIRHVKPTSRDNTASGLDLLGWSAGGKQDGTPTSVATLNTSGSEQQQPPMPTPLTPLPQQQQQTADALSPKPSEQVVPTDATQTPPVNSTSTPNNDAVPTTTGGDSWSPKRLQQQLEEQQQEQQDLLPTEIASSSIAEQDEPMTGNETTTTTATSSSNDGASIW